MSSMKLSTFLRCKIKEQDICEAAVEGLNLEDSIGIGKTNGRLVFHIS